LRHAVLNFLERPPVFLRKFAMSGAKSAQNLDVSTIVDTPLTPEPQVPGNFFAGHPLAGTTKLIFPVSALCFLTSAFCSMPQAQTSDAALAAGYE